MGDVQGSIPSRVSLYVFHRHVPTIAEMPIQCDINMIIERIVGIRTDPKVS